ncbi:MAG: PD-(D/E)XK nuclease family protein [Elusimicrobiota bacterium]|jgi:hypothetical protein|nr:PD-(D/E)XK nuclease family protein [Elusimicrobiota bacterium]
MQYEQLNALVEDYFKRKTEVEKEVLCFEFNLFDGLRINEDHHTHVLMQLLKYEYVAAAFLNEFIADGNLNIQKPQVAFREQYMDGKIFEQDYCVIIENKINNADDQYRQIERYIETALKTLKDKQKLFVIYLTQDGNKEISSESLTDKAKEILDYKTADDSGRFITINYRDDILPWLKDYVLPNCKFKDDILISGIKQYIDHLNGRFGLRERQKKIGEIMSTKIEEVFGISAETAVDKLEVLKSKRDELEKFKNDINGYIRNEVLGIDEFKKLSEEYLNRNNKDGDINFVVKEWSDPRWGHFLQFNKKSWTRHLVYFLWSLNDEAIASGNWSWDLQMKSGERERLKKKIEQNGFSQSPSKYLYHIRSKEYKLNKSFAQASDAEKRSFIESAYQEVEALSKIIDESLKQK